MGRCTLFTVLLRVFTLLVIHGMCLSRSIVKENIPDQDVRVTNKPRHHLARMMSNSKTRNISVAVAPSKTTTSHGLPVDFSEGLNDSTPTDKPSDGSTWDDLRGIDRLLYHLLRPKTRSNITNAFLAVTPNNVTPTPLDFPEDESKPTDKPSNSFRWHGMRMIRKIRYQLIRTLTQSNKTNVGVAVRPNKATHTMSTPLNFPENESKPADQPSYGSRWHDMRVIDELRYHLIRIMTQSSINKANVDVPVTPNKSPHMPTSLNFPAQSKSKPADKPSNGTRWQITFAVSGEGIPAGLALTFIAISLIVGVLFSPRRSWYSLIATRSRTIQTGSNVHRYIADCGRSI